MNRALPFLAAAVLMLPLLGAGLWWVSAAVANGEHRAYPVLAVNHFATLGWASTVAMAAMHQMFPAVLGASSRPGAREASQLALHAAGAAAVVGGFLAGRPIWIALGGTAVTVSAWLFAVLVVGQARRRKRWLTSTSGILLAVVHFTLAVTWGLLMGANWTGVFWPALLTPVGLGIHVALGVAGWFLQLIISVSYYLLPRFTSARDVGDGALPAILASLNAAVGLFVVAAAVGDAAPARVGGAALAAAGGLWARDLLRFTARRRNRGRDLNDTHWRAIAAIVAAQSAAGMAWALGWWRVEGATLCAAAVVSSLMGVVSFAIMGQIYKVTPFLMWFYRYGRGLTMLEIPQLPAPYGPAAGYPAFWLCAIGAAGFTAAVLARRADVGAASAAAFFAGTAIFSWLTGYSWIRAKPRWV